MPAEDMASRGAAGDDNFAFERFTSGAIGKALT